MDRSRLTWDFDYNVNLSDAASRRAWGRLLRRASARHEAAPARYDFGQRPGALQESLTRYLALTRGIHVSPAQIIVTNTYQHAFDLAARLFLEPGDAVVVEDPHALRMRHALLAGGARLIAIPGDDDGMRTDALARFRGPRARLAYTASSCSWVTMATLPLARRLELLAWARQADAWIIENDHNGEYVYQGTPIQPLQALDRDGRVIFMGTFSRLLHPDPLIGFLVVPEWLAGAFHAAALVDGAHASPVDTEVLARFIDSGEMESLVRRTTRRLRELRRALLDALENAEGITTRVRETRGGVHVHVRLPKVRPGDLDALVARAAKAGVGVFPDRPYYLRAPGVAGLMMGFAALSPALIGAGVARLAEVIRNFERDAQPR